MLHSEALGKARHATIKWIVSAVSLESLRGAKFRGSSNCPAEAGQEPKEEWQVQHVSSRRGRWGKASGVTRQNQRHITQLCLSLSPSVLSLSLSLGCVPMILAQTSYTQSEIVLASQTYNLLLIPEKLSVFLAFHFSESLISADQHNKDAEYKWGQDTFPQLSAP